MLKACLVAWLLLFAGDFLSTFLYHVPEHVFGKLHLTTHHAFKKNFRHYAILTVNLQVLLDGILGACPYLFMAALLYQVSIVGAIAGLLLGQFHVWWRHVNALGWQTPGWVTFACQMLFITTPEQHWLHHKNITVGFGDIFTVFDVPAQGWLRTLRLSRVFLRSFKYEKAFAFKL
ncbi:MAG: fatty acid hydroxylase [Acaryochloridaceae cyanobacterium RU_4_10]|nr:fatty acid hydroxylase [Acaryochloridaceae cyanobacterium RU_4_10]